MYELSPARVANAAVMPKWARQYIRIFTLQYLKEEVFLWI